ncbi:MAG: DUF86 domain-containing protein [Brevibacillus sp.]|nr:DUF86 domain-containing protein [Brevibacillus sp.]
MYNVNTERVEIVLRHMDSRLDQLRQLTARQDADILDDQLAVAAMERALHILIEAIVDVGNALIDGFIMRDPGSYTDVVEILRDERVIDDESAAVLTAVVTFRKALINDYTDVPHQQMINLVRTSLETIERFAPAVRRYIEQELF